jgi:hypothetical protein
VGSKASPVTGKVKGFHVKQTANFMLWNAHENTDDENLRWCWLRAVEWGKWPLFVSQPLLPLMLFVWSWKQAVLIVLVCNLVWRFAVTYNFVSVTLAYCGAVFVRLKWVVCPVCGYYFYSTGDHVNGLIALLWPVIILTVLIIPGVNFLLSPTHQIGVVQKRFMMKLGYEPKA